MNPLPGHMPIAREMPLVPGLPLLGSALDVLNDPGRALVDAYRTYGPAFRIRVLGTEVVVLAGSEGQQFFQTTGEKHFSRHEFFSAFSAELGVEDIILGASGPKHARLRAALKLGFCREAVAPHVPALAAAAREAAEALRPGRTLRLLPLVSRIGYDQFCILLAGHPVKRGFRAMDLYVQTIMEVASKIWPESLFFRPDYLWAKRESFALMRSLHQERSARVKAGGESLDGAPMTVIDALVVGNGKRGGGLTDDEIIGHALFGYVGGIFYMKRVLGFLLYEILHDETLMARVTAEADRAHQDGPLTAEKLRAMPVLRGALTESLRLYPIQLAIPFTADVDFEFEGYIVRAGSICYVSTVANQLSERYYGCPYAFDADRCMEPRNEHRPRGAFAPFGMGSRVCAAAGLVETMALTTVATLLHTVGLELANPPRRFRPVLNPLPGPSANLSIRVVSKRDPAARRSSAITQLTTGRADLNLDQSASLLPSLDPALLEQLLSTMKTRQYAAGKVIIVEGEEAEEFFVTLDGSADVLKSRPAGEAQRVGRLATGDYFGEIGLLTGSRRTATVRAGSSGLRALVLDRETFLHVVAESDLLSGELARLFHRRFLVNALLQALPSLRESVATRLLPDVDLARFSAGTAIVRQGEPAEAFYIVARGRVNVIRESPDGVRVPIAQLSAGEFFGELGLLHGIPRTATVEAVDDVDVAIVHRAAFQRLVRSTPGALTDVVGIVCERLANSLGASS
jgi:CRP-like cAMP-binding protein/cytochrome P450